MTKPKACEGCPLFDAPGPVPPEGDFLQAKLIYIAQNPGQVEVEWGRPLVGPSGNTLNRQLAETGIRRGELFLTNQVKCLTPGNREPTPAEIAHCRPYLEAELRRCRADTVLLAGAISFNSNVGSYSSLHKYYHPHNKRNQPSGIMTRMGCVEQRDGRKWIGTIHPANVMRQPENRLKALDHLIKAYSLSGVKVPLPEVTYYPPSDFIPHLIEEVNTYGCFSDDVETVGIGDVEEDDYVGADQRVTMCGIGYAPYKAAVFKPEQIHLLQPLFDNPGLWRYEHNGPFDNYHIERYIARVYHRAQLFDTMHAHHFLRSYDEKYLKPNVLSTYTNLPYYGRDLEEVNKELYNGMDCIATYHAALEETRLLKSRGLWDLFMEYGQPILPILEEMRQIGINTDARKVLLFRRLIQTKVDKAKELIAKLLGPFFNPGSPKQVKELLYEKCGLPVQYNGRGVNRTVTSDYEARKRLKHYIEKLGTQGDKHKTPYLFLTLQDYLEGEEQKLTFLDRVSPDARIHAFFKGHGTNTFRLSSKPNVQNFPVYDIMDWGGARATQDKDELVDPVGATRKQYGSLRSIVVPDQPEDWLVSCDYAQLQLWIMAVQFKVKWLLDIHDSGSYIYGEVYEKMCYPDKFFQEGKPRSKEYAREDISQKKLRRVKAVPLGFLFLRSAEAVAEEYGWTPEEGRKLRRWWFSNVPELEKAGALIEYKLKQQGWIRHCFNQIIYYPNLKASEAISSCAQSPEAFIMRGSIIQIYNAFNKRWGSYDPRTQRNRIILSVHDSLTFNLMEENLVEAVETIISPILRRPIPQLDGFQFDHSTEVGKMWDWEMVKYDKWKAAHYGANPGAASITGDPGPGGQESPKE